VKQKPIGNLLNEKIVFPFDESYLLDVYFATTRKEKGIASRGCNNSYFSPLAGNQMRIGSCQVNVPSQHAVGSLDAGIQGSSDKYFQMRALSEFQNNEILDRLKSSGSKEIILFVHGFNVQFEEAIYRSAQMKYDLKFQGEVISFSWPAGGMDESLLGQLFIKAIYEENFLNAVNSRIYFQSFLKSLIGLDKKIHLIVHSMGHQLVLPVVAQLAQSEKNPFLGELILNAPDFDRDEFRTISSDLIRSSERITLYCSPGDNALIASAKVNAKPRVGMCTRLQGIDVINVNEVDDPVLGIAGLGHGYYSSRPILTDIYQVLLGVKVEKRLFIRKSGAGNAEQFVLRK
jgi:esterase/lipase superfamily enzyme